MFGSAGVFSKSVSRPALGSDIPANVLMSAPSLFNVHLSLVANRGRQPYTGNKDTEGRGYWVRSDVWKLFRSVVCFASHMRLTTVVT